MAFWQNKPNRLLQEKELKISSEYSRGQWTCLFLLWLILLPIGIVIYIFGKVLIGGIITSGIAAFRVVNRILDGKTGAPEYKWQFLRAYLNNNIAMKLPHINSEIRRLLFRLSGITIGKNGFVGMGGYMEDLCPENIVIEDNATCSFGVTFIAHGVKSKKSGQEKYIILRSDCYVGAGSVILPGVEIGSKAIVGAGSIVTKDVTPGAVVAGSPARVLRYLPGYGPSQEGSQASKANNEESYKK